MTASKLPTVWWVTDQLPYPPRNGVTLPSYHHAVKLQAQHPINMVLLVDELHPPATADIAANEQVFGPIKILPVRRKGKIARVLEELAGRQMFQHGFDSIASVDMLDLNRGDYVVVTPISAVAKLRASGALAANCKADLLAIVNDCTAGEYYYRMQSRVSNGRDRVKAGIDHWRSRQIGRIERRLLQPYAHVFLQTSRDVDVFRHLVGGKPADRAQLLPNGVDESLFNLQRSPSKQFLFMAELSGEYGPIATWLVGEVWPRIAHSDFELLVVGKGAVPDLKALFSRSPGVRHVEYVPRLESVYEDAAIALSPVFKGFGLINKTIEPMAAGVPVIGGSAAFNGIEGFVAGQHGVVCEAMTTESFAAAMQSLMNDQARQLGIGKAARLLMRDRFRWADSTGRLAALLSSASTGRRSSAPHLEL